MARTGRPPVPNERKRLLGNPGKRTLPEPVEVVAAAEVPPDPPRPLSPEGMRIWNEVWEHGRAWLSPRTDLELVLVLCETADERSRLRFLVLQNPLDMKLAKALRQLDALYVSLLKECAFTPGDRSRLGLVEVRAQTKLEQLQALRHSG